MSELSSDLQPGFTFQQPIEVEDKLSEDISDSLINKLTLKLLYTSINEANFEKQIEQTYDSILEETVDQDTDWRVRVLFDIVADIEMQNQTATDTFEKVLNEEVKEIGRSCL